MTAKDWQWKTEQVKTDILETIAENEVLVLNQAKSTDHFLAKS